MIVCSEILSGMGTLAHPSMEEKSKVIENAQSQTLRCDHVCSGFNFSV